MKWKKEKGMKGRNEKEIKAKATEEGTAEKRVILKQEIYL